MVQRAVVQLNIISNRRTISSGATASEMRKSNGKIEDGFSETLQRTLGSLDGYAGALRSGSGTKDPSVVFDRERAG